MMTIEEARVRQDKLFQDLADRLNLQITNIFTTEGADTAIVIIQRLKSVLDTMETMLMSEVDMAWDATSNGSPWTQTR